MARIKRDIPQHLRPLANQIPPAVMTELPNYELGPRLLYAEGLLAQAEHEDPETAEKTRTHAARVLSAMPIDRYITEMARLDGALSAASAAEDFDQAASLFKDLLVLQAFNPQIPVEAMEAMLPATAGELRARNGMASRALGILGRR